MKDKIAFDIINKTGNGIKLTSKYFQEQYKISDVRVRQLFREIVLEEYEKENPHYIFGSNNEGFYRARTEEEARHAINYLFSKADKIYDRARKLSKTYERMFQKEFQEELFK